MISCNSLLEHRRILRQVDINDRVGHLQIQSGASRIRRQKSLALWIRLQLIHDLLSFALENFLFQPHERNLAFLQ